MICCFDVPAAQLGSLRNLSSAMLAEMSWEELRREARQLETDVTSKLVSYSKLGALFSTRGEDSVSVITSNSHVAESLSREIESVLQRVLILIQIVVDEKQNHIDLNPSVKSSE